jgi:tetratricopeptide (TPR) repeat protein
MPDHEDLLSLARSEPARALKRIEEELAGAVLDQTAQVRVRQAGAIAARLTGDLQRSNAFLQEAIALSVTHGDERGFVEANITRAGNSLLEGDPAGAVERLLSLEQPDDPELAARLGLQLGTIYARTAQFEPAIEHFTEGLEAARRAGDPWLIGAITKNRGMLRTYGGDYEKAQGDFVAARSAFQEAGIEIEVAYCDHDLGLVADYSGDLAAALRLFTQAEERIAELAGSEWEVQASRCDALLHAGLAAEAADLAARISAEMDRADHQLDRGEALLAWARAEMLRERFEEARRVAYEATGIFEAQGRSDWQAHAELMAAKARAHLGEPLDVAYLDELAERLASTHLAIARLEASIAAADALAFVEPASAVERLDTLRKPLRQAPADLRLAAVAALAKAHQSMGDRRKAADAARRSYRLLGDYQGLLSAGDVQVAVRQHARSAGEIGLRLAIESGTPRRIFDWLERDKWAMLHIPGAGRRDPVLRRALAEHRALDVEVRKRGGADDRLAELRRRAEARIRDHTRATAPGSPVGAPVKAADLVRQSEGTTIVSYGVHRGELLAVKLRSGRATTHRLGEARDAERCSRIVRATFGRILRGVDTADAGTEITDLCDRLVSPLGRLDECVVVLPTPSLFAAPWRALPGLAGRRVSVSPSATIWSRRRPGAADGSSLLVAGPDLEEGDREVRLLEQALPGAAVLTGSAASVDAVVQAMGSCRVAHIAAHGTNRTDNPLFSSLRLADGSMNVYELDGLANPPPTVVLSACHVGLPAEAPGRELLGLVGGLLRVGTRTIVAGTLPLPDTATTVGFMTAFHAALAAGSPPTAALVAADGSLGDERSRLVFRGAVTLFGGD